MLKVLPLNDQIHKREEFECRDEALNDFIKKRANQEHKKNISDTYVITNVLEPEIILGYFTLSNSGISLKHLPDKYKKGLPGYPVIGTTLLGRMARDLKTPPGFGCVVLKEAMKKSLDRSGAFYALEVVAKNDNLVNYYLSFGFIPLQDDRTHLFLPKITIENAMKNSLELEER